MRLGIFGGTFDPVHYGHLRIAEEAREQAGLDRVLFVPNRVSPFKTGRPITPGAIRAEMLRSAVADNPAFYVSEIELERPGPSYSVDTITALQEATPRAEWFFITGTDAVRDLPGWRQPEEILRRAVFLVALRPGANQADVVSHLPAAWLNRLRFVEIPLLDISGTDLRARVRRGRSIRYFVPPVVEALIRERGLYQGETVSASLEK